MKDKLAKLIDVKSIVTLLLTALFCYLAITGKVSQEVMQIYTVVIAFFFGTKIGKESR